MFYEWFENIPIRTNPLFAEDDFIARTTAIGNRKILVRHENTDNAIIETVRNGLNVETWQGFLYIMGYNDTAENYWPLYVGKTGKTGRINPINANIRNIEGNRSRFARWGHGDYWHIGQLSNSLFQPDGKTSQCKHDNWATELFEEPFEQAKLKRTTYLAIVSWQNDFRGPSGGRPTLEELEGEIIHLAREINPNLLNIQG